MTRAQFRHVVLVPVATWAVLATAILVTCLYAFFSPSPVKPAVSLAIAAGQATVSGIVFARLNRATALVRFAAAAGFVWLSFLFILAFADYLTRAYPM